MRVQIKKFKLYKQLRTDIWGKLVKDLKFNKSSQSLIKVLKFEFRFIRTNLRWWPGRKKFYYRSNRFNRFYNLKKEKFWNKQNYIKKKYKNYYGWLLQNKLLFKLFYKLKNDKMILQYKKRYKNDWHKIINKLESKLEMILFRFGCFGTLPVIRKLIKYRNFAVNGQSIDNPNYNINKYDYITINPKIKNKYLIYYKNLIKKQEVFIRIPKFLYICYKTWTIFLLDNPKIHNDKNYKFPNYPSILKPQYI